MTTVERGLNPFPGLRPFTSDENHLFFGREDQIATLLSLLRTHRFLAVVGSSGSGKSSLVRAGLIPALHRGTMTHAGSTWEVVVLRPGGNPVTNLARAIVEADLYDSEDAESLPRVRATLSRSLYGLVEAVKQSDQLAEGTNLLVVVDQFEELFRYRQQGAESEEAAAAFVSLLLAATNQREKRIYVAITMRSDYLGDCSQIPGLAEVVNCGEYLIPRLSRDQKREAIEKPVGVGGAKIAPRLVQRMLNDVGDDPDQLPVLQHALMRTWDAWVEQATPGEPLDLDHYESIGGMEEALSRHADEVYAALPDDRHRKLCERMFKNLAEKGADNRGVRRPTRLEKLEQIVACPRDAVTTVIDRFRAAGVTFLMPGPEVELDSSTVIDLSHESLMRVWTRLRRWVDEESQSARIYRRLHESAGMWQEGMAGLYRDPDLQIALTWREASLPNAEWAEQYGGRFAAAMKFLDDSAASTHADELAREAARQRELDQANALAAAEGRRAREQQRSARRMRMLSGVAAVVALLAVAAFVVAMQARKEAVSNANLAQEKETAATQAASELQRTLANNDFTVGVEKAVAGDNAGALSHLARALRTDEAMWPAGMRAMSILASGRLSLANLPTIEQRRVITGYRFNAAENLLFTWDAGETVPKDEIAEGFVWDMLTGKQLYQIAAGKKFERPEWTEDGRLLFAYLSDDKAIQAWDARTGEPHGPAISVDAGYGFRLHEDPSLGLLVLIQNPDRTLQVLGAANGEPVTPKLQRPAPPQQGFGFVPGGKQVYGVFSDNIVTIWSLEGGTQLAEMSAREHPLDSGNADVYFSPDGKTVAVRSLDKKWVHWWRWSESTASDKWQQFEEPVELSFIRDQDRLVVSSQGTQAKPAHAAVFDLASGQRVAQFDTPQPGTRFVFPVTAPADSRGSAKREPVVPIYDFPLVAATDANLLRFWELRDGQELPPIATPALLTAAEFSPEGRRIASVALGNDVMLWDVFTRQPLLREPLRHRGAVELFFSPDGERLVTHDAEKQLVQMWDSRSGDLLAEPTPQMFLSRDGVFTTRGERMLLYQTIQTSTGSFRRQTKGEFRIVDSGIRPAAAETLQIGQSLPGVDSAMYAPDGDSVVVCGTPRVAEPFQVMVYGRRSRRLERSWSLPQGILGYSVVQMTKDGGRLALMCDDRKVRIWDFRTGQLLHELSHEQALTALALSDDGLRVATGTDKGKVQAWDIATGTPLFEPQSHGEVQIQEVVLSPDGSLLVSGSLDYKFRFADGRTGNERFETLNLNQVYDGGSAFTPDGAFLAAAPFGETVHIVDSSTGKVLRELKHDDAVRMARFSPDGRLLAVTTGGVIGRPVGEVVLWNWRQGARVGRPLITKGAAKFVRFSRDGQLLVTGTMGTNDDTAGGTGGNVQVWHVASGQAVTDPVRGVGSVAAVDFHPSGTELVAAWADGTVRVIDLPPRAPSRPDWLASLAEAVAGRRLAPGDEGIQQVPRESLDEVRGEIAGPGNDAGNPYAVWGRWYLTDPEERTVSPGSKLPFANHLARLRQSARPDDLLGALALAPADPLTYARLSQVLSGAVDGAMNLDEKLRRHWQDTALWYSRRSVELGPENPQVWALRSEVLRKLGQEEAAAGALERSAGLAESRGFNTQYLKAVELARSGRWSQADEEFRLALDAIEPSDAESGSSELAVTSILTALRPFLAPAEFRDLRLPDPIPGTFEDFESTAEGAVPAGWTVRHDAPSVAAETSGLAEPWSDGFRDWTVVSTNRVAGWKWGGGSPARLLTQGGREQVQGRMPGALLQNHFLLALDDERPWGQVQYVTTPDFACSGRKEVHLVFHSAFEQNQNSLAGLEYSIDEGATWLPVAYLLEASDIVRDASGKVDAVATLEKRHDDVPHFVGARIGGSYGEFVAARSSRDLDPHLDGRRDDDPRSSKRREVYRLPRADGQAKVRLRFALAGGNSWYWGIDDLGLYEIPPALAPRHPQRIVPAQEPRILAGLGVANAFGVAKTGGTAALLEPNDLLKLTVPEAATGSTSTGGSAGDGQQRRRLDGALLLMRAAALDPADREIALCAAAALATAGAAEEAVALERRALQAGPVDRFLLPSLAIYYEQRADRLAGQSQTDQANVLYELAYVLNDAHSGSSPPRIIERLAVAGLAGKGTVLLPRGSTWRYFDREREPAAGWKDADFDDSSWSPGKARLGYGGDGEVTTIGFGPDPKKKLAAAYFRTTFEVAQPELAAQLKLRFQRDDGVIVYLNGQEILRSNMPTGAVGPDTLASSTVSNQDETRFFESDVLNPPLRPGTNVLAAEVHQATLDSSDLGFDLEIEGVGGLGASTRQPDSVERDEDELGIPSELRSVLWTSRAARLLAAGKPEDAADALARAARLGPTNPAASYYEARLLQQRGDDEAAYWAFVKAVDATLALKSGAHQAYPPFLPALLKTRLEPLVRCTALNVAQAARQAAAAKAGTSPAEVRWLLRRSAELDDNDPQARLERAKVQWDQQESPAVLAATDAQLASLLEAATSPLEVRLHKDWLALRERRLRGLGQTDEADQVRKDILAVPPRRPDLSPKLIDLGEYYNASLYDGRGWHAGEEVNLKLLPETYQQRGGIDFDLRGLIQLNSGKYSAGADSTIGEGQDVNSQYQKDYPFEVADIRVGQKTPALHFLMACIHGRGKLAEVAKFIVHYEDGSQAEVPVRYEDDLLDWTPAAICKRPAAWVTANPYRVLWDVSWQNPHPDLPIRAVEFVSAQTTAAPFLAAITAE